MQQLTSLADVVAASGADPQCIWAAQGLKDGGRAFEHGGGVAVACPALAGRDRLVVRGPAAAAASLVRAVIDELGPQHVISGDPALMGTVLDRLSWLERGTFFGWMDSTQLAGHKPEHTARWLSRREWPDAAEVLGVATPHAHTRPGVPGVRRWAGISGPDGRLTCTAADAWSTPGVGFLAGVAVLPEAQRTTQGRDVCAFVLSALLAAHGRAALMVAERDTAKIGLYTRLGMSFRLQQRLWVSGQMRAGLARRLGGE
jgi:ribosomal protein S18 acetylase RimI-like enzyme